MTQQNLKPHEYLGDHVRLQIDDPELNLEKAKDLAKQKARELCSDPMLLSWHNGKTGEFYPNVECGPGHKPPWIVYAEARGGNLTIDVNDGAYLFFYLKL